LRSERFGIAIAQDTKTVRRFRRHHKNASDWLKDEVERLTQTKWLAYWDKKTGQTKPNARAKFGELRRRRGTVKVMEPTSSYATENLR
jgi:hypothetical protein